jgi:hypothetical protein
MKSRAVFPVLILAGLLLLIFSIRSCVREMTEAPRRGLEQTAQGVRSIFHDFANFQPEVVIHQTVVHTQTTGATELTLVQKETLQEYQWSHRWMGSTKTIKVSGTYRAKAGFDLRERFVVTVGPKAGEVTAELPPARLLSVEQVGKLGFSDEGGYWNRLNSQDREEALNQAKEAVRVEIMKSDLLKEAEKEAIQQLGQLGRRQGLSLKVIFLSNRMTELGK